jgi:hypothetical protein
MEDLLSHMLVRDLMATAHEGSTSHFVRKKNADLFIPLEI